MRELYKGDSVNAYPQNVEVPLNHILLEGRADVNIAKAIFHGINEGVARGIFDNELAGNNHNSIRGLQHRMPLDMRLWRYANQTPGKEACSYRNTVIYGEEARLALEALDISIESNAGPAKVVDPYQRESAIASISEFIAWIECER